MLNVVLAPPRRHRSLTVFPLLGPESPELPYLLMADALTAGILKITEVGSGTVPGLHAINGGDAAILVLDGEQLVGAKQNRTTNRSLLLAARSETEIPVSCMEQGRWRFDSDHFQPTKHSSPSGVRRKAREVEASYARAGAPAAPRTLAEAQGQVWVAIAEHSSALGEHSDTHAMNDLYDTRAGHIQQWVAAFPPEPRQIGLLAFLGDRPLGMDVIGCGRLYPRLHARLLAGYVMDALATPRRRGRPTSDGAQEYLDEVGAAARAPAPTVGLGRYAVLSGGVIGGELADDEGVVHLSAFPAFPGRTREGDTVVMRDPVAPPSRRRRRLE